MDLQEAADQVINLGRQNNQPFFNQVDGKNIVNRNPGIGEVLERGGMNARQVGDVAKAMFALEAARRNPINKAQTRDVHGAGRISVLRASCKNSWLNRSTRSGCWSARLCCSVGSSLMLYSSHLTPGRKPFF